jgi:hypothetical protein
MSTIPVQPNLPQYPISDLYLFANYPDRAAYLAAVGTQAPPYNPALPIKGWADPAPGGQPYLMFDAAVPPAYTVELAVPASAAGAVNLPGAYSYPAYVEIPTDAQIVGPYGPIGPVPPHEVCLEADAQAVANAIAPLYPSKTATVVDNSEAGIYHVVYGADPRRMWGISISGGPLFDYAQSLIEAAAEWGAGAPGHWAMAAPLPGTEPVGTSADAPALQWVQDSQITAAPADAVTLPAPIRPLLPNEQFQLVPPSNPLFGQATWMVVRTDLQPAITVADVQQFVAQYNAQPGVAAIAIV